MKAGTDARYGAIPTNRPPITRTIVKRDSQYIPSDCLSARCPKRGAHITEKIDDKTKHMLKYKSPAPPEMEMSYCGKYRLPVIINNEFEKSYQYHPLGAYCTSVALVLLFSIFDIFYCSCVIDNV